MKAGIFPVESEMVTVPFKVDALGLGIAESHGLMRLDGDELHLEYQTRDGLIGIFKSGVKTVSIPVKHLSRVDLEKGLFSTQLILRANSMMALEKVPGTESDEAVFKIRRRDRKRAAVLVSELNLAISEARLAAIRGSSTGL